MAENTVIIEKGIPIPERTYGSRLGRAMASKYSFLHKMEVDDSTELRVIHTKGLKNTRHIKQFTYYGLMNAITKIHTDTKKMEKDFRRYSSDINDSVEKKFSTRTIRVEQKSNGDVVRVIRVWRLK